MIGDRHYLASIQRHRGTRNEAGAPDYYDDDQWFDIVTNWPCEKTNPAGAETSRGLQTTATANYVLFGDALAIRIAGVTTRDRVMIDGERLAIVAIGGTSAMSQEANLECRVEE